MAQVSIIRATQISGGGGGGLTNPVEFLLIQDADGVSTPTAIDSTLFPRILMQDNILLANNRYGARLAWQSSTNSRYAFIGPRATQAHIGNSNSDTTMLEFWSALNASAETFIFAFGLDPSSTNNNSETHIYYAVKAYFQSNPVYIAEMHVEDVDTVTATTDITSTTNPRLILQSTPILSNNQYGARIAILGNSNTEFGFIGARATQAHTGAINISNTTMIEFHSARGNNNDLIFAIGRDPLSTSTNTTEAHLKVVEKAYFQSEAAYIAEMRVEDVDAASSTTDITATTNPRLILQSTPILSLNQYGARIAILGNSNTEFGFIGARATQAHTGAISASNTTMLEFHSARGTSNSLVFAIGLDPQSTSTNTTETHLKVVEKAYFQSEAAYIAEMRVEDVDAASSTTDITATTNPRLILQSTPILSLNQYGARIAILGNSNTEFGFIGARATQAHTGAISASNTTMLEFHSARGTSNSLVFAIGNDPQSTSTSTTDNHMKVDVGLYVQEEPIYAGVIEVVDIDSTSTGQTTPTSTTAPNVRMQTQQPLANNRFGGILNFRGAGGQQFASITPRATQAHVSGNNANNTSMMEFYTFNTNGSERRVFSYGRDPSGLDSDYHARFDDKVYFEEDVCFASGIDFEGIPVVATRYDFSSTTGVTTTSPGIPTVLNFGNQSKPNGTHDIFATVTFTVGNRQNEAEPVLFELQINNVTVSETSIELTEGNEINTVVLTGRATSISGTNVSVRVRTSCASSTTLTINFAGDTNGNILRLDILREGEL